MPIKISRPTQYMLLQSNHINAVIAYLFTKICIKNHDHVVRKIKKHDRIKAKASDILIQSLK